MGKVRGKDWMQEHVADRFVRRAQREGLRSRAAFKLEQIADRDRLLLPGMTVVDLGAAPGGWSQIAAKRVGPAGRVIALDILDMVSLPGVTFVSGDFHEEATVEALVRALEGRRVDLVLCDLAPNLTGVKPIDQPRMIELAELALQFAVKHLKPQGNFLVKLFHGGGFDGFVARMRKHFREVMTRKPDASRSRSSEVYLLGRGRTS
jgi:23S rRNA (uridine2552-2'-O)-methyltransferase